MADLVIDFKVQKNGTISEIKTSHSSGSANLDKLGMQTIPQAAPFPSLPSKSSIAAFQFHFVSPQPSSMRLSSAGAE